MWLLKQLLNQGTIILEAAEQITEHDLLPLSLSILALTALAALAAFACLFLL